MTKRPPTATYRLQLHAGFTFEDASEIAAYLKDLGVSHVYSSPYLQAAPGSMHGYDVVDHERANEELGGEAGLERFSTRLGEVGLGQVLDVVPNHMAIGPENRYWWDVLENGPSSRFSDWFDIDWNSPEIKLQNKVLIPVLGEQYGRVLSAGEIKLEREDKAFRVRYHEQVYPVAPRSLAPVLWRAAEYARVDMLVFIADSLSRLPAPDSTDRGVALARHRDKTVIFELLHRLCEEQSDVCQAIDRCLDEINGNTDQLDDVLNHQNYRLAYWRTADQELGYRRFFDVNTLVGLRMEREHVFLASHNRILEWLKNGNLDGVRIDHPDGLRDPRQYFERLRQHAPSAWIVAEKILEPGETLPASWPIEGTSGYDFLNVCNGLLVNPGGLEAITQTYGEFTGQPVDFAALAREKKLNVEHEGLGSDVNRLASLFAEICENNRDHRDHTRAEIRRAIREVAACFPVYRTYADPQRGEILPEDIAFIEAAVAKARDGRLDIDASLFDFIGEVLMLRSRGRLEDEFVLRFQQFTSPVMAKGVEDTAFYCFNRMIGLNEVGADPGRDGLSIDEFHEYCAMVQKDFPFTLSTLATHDNKRSDDVRARLAVLTETSERWKAALLQWAEMNKSFRSGQFPDPNTEYFLYQTLIGAWPIPKERLMPYMEKATREAKQQTSWTQQNKEFEDALKAFMERILESPEFTASLEEFVNEIKQAGRINGLAQTLIKLTAPGIPDTYQGGELWDMSLVDPDNRRPVDYVERRRLLDVLNKGIGPKEAMAQIDSGLPKMLVISTALRLRREHPEWFDAEAAYTPILATGARREHLVAFTRGHRVAVLAPRWPLKLAGEWGDEMISLPEGTWTNLFTKESVDGKKSRLQAVFGEFPVALLTREDQ